MKTSLTETGGYTGSSCAAVKKAAVLMYSGDIFVRCSYTKLQMKQSLYKLLIARREETLPLPLFVK